MKKVPLILLIILIIAFPINSICHAKVREDIGKVTILSPLPNTTVQTKDGRLSISWTNTDTTREYWYEVMLTPVGGGGVVGCTDKTSLSIAVTEDLFATVTFAILYNLKDDLTKSPRGSYSGDLTSTSFFTITIQKGADTSTPIQDPISDPISTPDPLTPTLPSTSDTTTYIPPVVSAKEITNWVVNTMDSGDVLGVADYSKCRFKYVKGQNHAQNMGCTIPTFAVLQAKIFRDHTTQYLVIQGTMPTRINVSVDLYTCKKDLLDPSTWFTCKEVFTETKNISLFTIIDAQVYSNTTTFTFKSFAYTNNSFQAITNSINNTEDLRMSYTFKAENKDLKIFFNGGGDITLKAEVMADIDNQSKPFTTPLSNITEVTQWHGFTAYESPHMGIDLVAVKESILAVSDGIVESKGWDNYNGECNSGGNYLIIKQSNGMYTAYFHLTSTSVSVGQKVKTNQVLGISGNTGAWNCQSLGYHLHFETRAGRAQSTHVDPVIYINADWGRILTRGGDIYPQRLTGDNPHPGK